MGSSLPEEVFPRAQEREEETQSGMLRSFISSGIHTKPLAWPHLKPSRAQGL